MKVEGNCAKIMGVLVNCVAIGVKVNVATAFSLLFASNPATNMVHCVAVLTLPWASGSTQPNQRLERSKATTLELRSAAMLGVPRVA